MFDLLRARVARDDFVVSEHALQQMVARSISLQELIDAVATCELVEDYPEDPRGPSSLYLGFSRSSRPLHFQFTSPHRRILRVITVYEPDPGRWIDHRLRRQL